MIIDFELGIWILGSFFKTQNSFQNLFFSFGTPVIIATPTNLPLTSFHKKQCSQAVFALINNASQNGRSKLSDDKSNIV